MPCIGQICVSFALSGADRIVWPIAAGDGVSMAGMITMVGVALSCLWSHCTSDFRVVGHAEVATGPILRNI